MKSFSCSVFIGQNYRRKEGNGEGVEADHVSERELLKIIKAQKLKDRLLYLEPLTYFP